MPESCSPLPDIKALTAGLTAVFHAPVTVAERRLNDNVATNASEIAICRFADGTQRAVFCKYGMLYRPGRPGPATAGAPSSRHGEVAYEAMVHRDVLEPAGICPLKIYGSYTNRTTGMTWLFVEYLEGGVTLHTIEDASVQAEAMGAAARWIGGFHAAQEARLSGDGMPPLVRFDAAYYRRWTGSENEEFVDLLLAQPPTVIHGDFFCDNCLFRDGAVYPVDWSLAAIAAGELDLAMLTDNWPPDIVERCEREYRQARWPEGPHRDWGKVLDAARHYLALYLTGMRGAREGAEAR